jgi:hypothetical protein
VRVTGGGLGDCVMEAEGLAALEVAAGGLGATRNSRISKAPLRRWMVLAGGLREVDQEVDALGGGEVRLLSETAREQALIGSDLVEGLAFESDRRRSGCWRR